MGADWDHALVLSSALTPYSKPHEYWGMNNKLFIVETTSSLEILTQHLNESLLMLWLESSWLSSHQWLDVQTVLLIHSCTHSILQGQTPAGMLLAGWSLKLALTSQGVRGWAGRRDGDWAYAEKGMWFKKRVFPLAVVVPPSFLWMFQLMRIAANLLLHCCSFSGCVFVSR